MFREGSFSWFKRDKTDEGEKTKRIPGGGDGVSLEPHPFAGEKDVDIPFNDNNTNRDQNNSSEVADSSTEEGMEGWLDKKMEAEKNDPSLNPEKGVVVGEDYIIKDGKVIKDEIGEFGEEIEDAGYEDWHADEVYWHGIREGVKDKNIAGKKEVGGGLKLEDGLNEKQIPDYSTSVNELGVKEKMSIKDLQDGYSSTRLRMRRNRNMGQKTVSGNRPTGIRKILGK